MPFLAQSDIRKLMAEAHKKSRDELRKKIANGEELSETEKFSEWLMNGGEE